MLLKRASDPTAVFRAISPLLVKRANAPIDVLLPPIVLLKSALSPTAVLEPPSVLLKRANAPSARFPLPLWCYSKALLRQ